MKMNLKDFQKCNHQTSRISHDILQQQQQGDHDILILFQTYILLLNMLLEIPNYSLRELSLLVFRTPNFTEEIHQENAEAEAMINQRSLFGQNMSSWLTLLPIILDYLCCSGWF
ncbi:unnamed protein product [Amaranthus hypochondriacus]